MMHLLSKRYQSFLQLKGKHALAAPENKTTLHENCFGSPTLVWHNKQFNEGLYKEVLSAICNIKKLNTNQLLLGRTRADILQGLLTIFCDAHSDNVVYLAPYSTDLIEQATLALVHTKPVNLISNTSIDFLNLSEYVDEHTKMIVISNPNTILGTTLPHPDIIHIIENYNGLVVIDETYIQFSNQSSLLTKVLTYPNCLILQSFNEAWGLAGIKMHALAAHEDIIQSISAYFNPTQLASPLLNILKEAAENYHLLNQTTTEIVLLRNAFMDVLKNYPLTSYVFNSNGNFIAAQIIDAEKLIDYAKQKGVHLINLYTEHQITNGVCFTVGTEQQLTQLFDVLNNFLTHHFLPTHVDPL